MLARIRAVMSAHGVPGPNAKGCVVVDLKGVAKSTIESMWALSMTYTIVVSIYVRNDGR